MINLLNDELTDAKRELGFRKVWVENERNRFGATPKGGQQILRAVAYPAETSVWIFEINSPLPKEDELEWHPIVYWEMQYSLLSNSEGELPYWHIVRAAHCIDPLAAIQAAKEQPRDQEFIPKLPPQIDTANRRILYPGGQVSERDIELHGGEMTFVDGSLWVAFPIQGAF